MIKRTVPLRYFEDGQRSVHGSFSHSKDDLLKSNLFEYKEWDIANEALRELLIEGFLEYDRGRYYLKGHSPKV